MPNKSWLLVVAVQLVWLVLLLAFIYCSHYLDHLSPVDLAALYRLERRLDEQHAPTRWSDLSPQERRAVHWWQNWTDETRLSRLPVLGTHHSATYSVNNVLSLFAKTQKHTLVEQMNRGVRCLDIRLKCVAGNGLRAYHDIVDLNLTWRRLWMSIEGWLRAYPTEGLLMFIRDETYRNHYLVAKQALDELDEATRRRFFVLNDEQFRLAGSLTVGQLRGRVLLVNQNERFALPWADNREFVVGRVRVHDIYDPSQGVSGKVAQSKKFYESAMVGDGLLNVLFTSLANHNPLTSVQLVAGRINSEFWSWLNDQPVKGCVIMSDWVE